MQLRTVWEFNFVDEEALLPTVGLALDLQARLLEQLRSDPLAYIKDNTGAPRVVDLRSDRKSALSQNQKDETPRHNGLRHGLDTQADAFGEELYSKAKKGPAGTWLYEHPGTGRWADWATIAHWLRSHKVQEVLPTEGNRGWLRLPTSTVLASGAERFYYPREWNEFGSWVTKAQLQAKLEQFRKDKANAR